MPTEATNDIVTDSLIDRLIAEKKAANDVQKHKHQDWNDNYDLNRNKVRTNRLTQRQAVAIPLMKETMKTMMSKIDDPPNIEWKELGGDETKQIIYQEIWDTNFQDAKLELVDVLDKKNVLLYGIGTKMLNIWEKGIKISALDVFDVAFDPFMTSGDIESARFVVQQNIFKSVSEILADPKYSDEGKEALKTYADSPAGLTQSEENRKHWEEKMQRMRDMGLDHDKFPLFAGGDRMVNLTQHFTTVWNNKTLKWERRVCVYADDTTLLLNKTLMELIGVDFWPLTIWSEDPETNDIYPDAVADLVRVPNQVINVWFSQMIENRTLKNFQMHWFLPMQGYKPQTYTPGPGVMLPAPPGDDINKVIKPVEISGLDDTMLAISALTAIVERGTGATAIDKGVSEKGAGQQTLGEIEILVGKSVERAIGMAKFYRMAWYELAVKWNAMMQANGPKILDLYKTSRTGKIYAKRVYASDWKSTKGYKPTVSSSSEQEQESLKTLQKFDYLLKQFPNNKALRKIAQKRMFESVELTPEEMKLITTEEEQMTLAPTEVSGKPQDLSLMQDHVSELASSLTA